MLPLAAGLLASIPSPPANAIEIGPLRITAYGVAIATGVVVAVEMGRRRWEARGGDPDDVGRLAMWVVPAGLVGARLYHVATDWYRYEGRWLDALKIWQGGLGIPGAILLGALVGVWAARRMGLRVSAVLDMGAPCVPVAQAIGRLGNWFNQELYGKPTDLPWGLEIDPEHRVAGYEAPGLLFHPTFLYEALWNVTLALFLLWVERRHRLRPGRLFALYVGGYSLGRVWVESLRIDPATEVAGLRVNIWTSIVTLAAVVLVLLVGGLRERSPADSAADAEDSPELDRSDARG
ncbi:MAG: hypothetical protein KatS3mg008_2211 [Acidimicrobiales bacterium]|nr:MAG: hypothetical protein KatS3mg008_2211 [Acidimicrobiales bacterium]